MRMLVAVLLLGSTALAYPYHGHRHHRGHSYSNHGFRYHAKYVGYSHGFRYHAKYVPYGHRWGHRGYYRVYRPTHRSHYRYRRYYYPRYHGDSYNHYGHGYYGHRYGYRYGHHYGYRPYLSFSPIYTRMMTVLTIDDPEFDGAAAAVADNDGVPRPRSKPVGSRFLINLD